MVILETDKYSMAHRVQQLQVDPAAAGDSGKSGMGMGMIPATQANRGCERAGAEYFPVASKLRSTPGPVSCGFTQNFTAIGLRVDPASGTTADSATQPETATVTGRGLARSRSVAAPWHGRSPRPCRSSVR